MLTSVADVERSAFLIVLGRESEGGFLDTVVDTDAEFEVEI